ncbi:putative Zn(II)2Cys6 transcription factor-like protein [Boeremia exigua]|uniref:putative Zn(II)2Cys6 transcription factor-like protein n=1 Tax=Boeremia exigua TaxID=749465 RepID=UPI001E8D18F1|nr:putative Zn(II)2Cys6 transcription factor-like protein [Boeremia exigua]KAH6625911.1 putative Zn(II)2Cys6 transcription factor-like protein [Boeremia exigua]
MVEPKPRQRKFAPRSRTGCLTCRARRKRCDNRRPTCDNCTRLNLSCDWQAQRKLIQESSPSSSSSPEEVIESVPDSLGCWDLLPGDAGAERQHLLQYYIEKFVPSVSVATTPTSFYTALYMPWAFQTEGMLDAILALSSAQLARRTDDKDRASHLRTVSLRHQRLCSGFIKDRLSPSGQPLRDTYQVVAIILLLVGLEALKGNKSTTWIQQLKCVRKILDTLSPEQSIVDCVEVDSLHRHFTYHYAMASVMSQVSASATTPAPSLEHDLLPMLNVAMPLTIDPLMGIAYQMCDLISKIQYVVNPDPAFPQLTEATFNAIESGIQAWTYESPFASGVDLPVALDLIALAESYRLSALIQLYRNSQAHASLVPGCAARAMEFIMRIPPGSPAESSLLYPIFMAGAELDSEVAIDRLTKRLKDISDRNRYENIDSVQKVLKEVWRPKLEGGTRRCWEDVLREWEWSFTLG